MTARIIKKWMILLLAVTMLISMAPLNVSASASASETDKTYQAYDASRHREVINENGTTDSEWSLCMVSTKRSPGTSTEATGEYSKNENATKDMYASNGGKGDFQKIKRMLFYKLKHPQLNYTVLQNEYYYQQDNKKIYDTDYSQSPELNKQKQDLRTFAEDSSHDDEINSTMEVFIYKSKSPEMQNLISAKLKEVPTPPSTKVKFSKKALTENGEELKGATIQLTKEDGSLVKEWVTDGTVTEFELKDGKYTFTETSAPAKYQVATAITFEVKNGKAIVKGIEVTGNTIVMVDKLKEVPTPPSTKVKFSKKALPKTGESGSLGAFLSALELSLAGLGVLYKKMKDCE
ncbi:SpaA isopeptide-forming pilin-related protein [Amygdalobacter nucleatus]|uniref:SpaA isopeptide-forming pilin-related protein n=1 Tax=Amygdalobacter nucleatus TaxID=3029274 RepID=UPI0027A5581C|nr:SpaA isopeptide-forming pilin-related protein [Amygdalobacter nucleatus]WEG36992.1 SpaA isopeptide-forming pilin-related protein [Amygdalobacter nucleatus]